MNATVNAHDLKNDDWFDDDWFDDNGICISMTAKELKELKELELQKMIANKSW